MRCTKWMVLYLVFCAGLPYSSLFALSKIVSEQVGLQGPAIGVKTLALTDEARSRPVFVELWYPTDQKEPIEEANHELWIYPKEIRNASYLETGSKYPLIMMSHGHAGDRRDRSWLAEKLVRSGFMVASVEHFGNTRAFMSPLISLRFWERPRDVSFALSSLLRDEAIAERIDPTKVGFVGYSLGGMTGLSLAGAKAQDARGALKKQIKEIQDEWLEAIDFSEAEASFAEPRIRSFLLLCPATFVFPPHSLKNVKTTVGLVAAIGDEVLPHKEHAYQIIKHLLPTKLKVMRREISHYSFLNQFSENGKRLVKKTIYEDPACCNRADIHKEVGKFAVEFFKETLSKSR